MMIGLKDIGQGMSLSYCFLLRDCRSMNELDDNDDLKLIPFGS
jgi:hypothetical protein